jgi:putative endonuclease
MARRFYVYITTNPAKQVLYTGMTNWLDQRIVEHYLNRGKPDTFAGRYYCYCLLYWEDFNNAADAIDREKEIKGWRREKKLALIKKVNPKLSFLNKRIMSDWPPKNAQSRFSLSS